MRTPWSIKNHGYVIFGQIIKTHTFIQMKDNKIQKEAFPWNLLKILSYSRTISQFLNINDWSFFTFQPEQQIAHPATPRRGWPQVECSLTFYPSSPFHLPPHPDTHTHIQLSPPWPLLSITANLLGQAGDTCRCYGHSVLACGNGSFPPLQ